MGKNDLQVRNDLYFAGNLFQLTLHHFALGIYPVCSPGKTLSMPLNRMFYVLENRGKESNFLREESGEKHVFRKNTLYFIPSGTPVEMRLGNDLRFLSVQCSMEIFRGVDLFSSCGKIRIVEDPEELPVLLKIFFSRSGELHLEAFRFRAVIEKRVSALFEEYPSGSFEMILRFRKYGKLIEWIHRNADARTRVQDLAEHESSSREYFTRKFRSETGMTPKQLLENILLSRILKLFSGGMQIREITEELHFSDEFVFSHFFKRLTGYPPSRRHSPER